MSSARIAAPSVAIIGGGFGGLAVAIRLARAGHRDITIFERDERIGGTWQANTYPGVACDAPSHIYSFSYAPNPSWSRRFAPGEEIRAYLERCADEAGLRANIRTGCPVSSATWDGQRWQLVLGDGSTLSADVLVPACGPLSEPRLPNIPGVEDFKGDVFHTARWRPDVDLRDQRIGVVGTGASGVQSVPRLAEIASNLTVFQRSAPYVFEKPDAEYSARIQALYTRLPGTQRLARWLFTWLFDIIGLAFWLAPRATRLMERKHRKYLEATVQDPDLRAALTPDHRAGCKRPAMESAYYPALMRSNVNLETRGIEFIEPTGVRLADGDFVELDTLVFATGFQTQGFATSLEIRGRDDVELQEAWSEGPRAFLGMSVPRFPNMFLVYGPNTNLGSGSILIMIEAQAAHIASAVDALTRSPEPIEVRPDAFQREAARIDRRLPRTIWSSGCGNWYVDDSGRDTHNWPGSMADYRRRTTDVRDRDYLRLPARVPEPTS